MDIQQFIADFEAFRKQNPFLENTGDKFKELHGKIDNQTPTTATWAEMNPNSYTRVSLPDGERFLWYYRNEEIAGRKRSFGILIPWDLLIVIKDIHFDSQSEILTLVIKENSRIIFFDSTRQQMIISNMKKFVSLERPISGTDTTSIDSKSPGHLKQGMTEMRTPFQL